MDGATALTLLTVGLKGAGLVQGIRQGQLQEQISKNNLRLEAATARQQAAEESFLTAKNFRQSLGSQLAISALRSQGGGSIARQFAASSIANMFADEKSFKQRQQFIDLSEAQGNLQLKMQRRANKINLVGDIVKTGVNMFNFSGITPGGNPSIKINK